MKKAHPISKWDQVKKNAMKTWTDLTDDDFKKVEGDLDKLYGFLQVKFGETREAIKVKLDKLHMD